MTATDTPIEPPTAVAAAPNWQDQDEVLRDLWSQNHPPNYIAEQLGRSVAAIMTRAVRLGLPRRAAPGRKPGRRLPDEMRKPGTSRTKVAVETIVMPHPEAGERICLMCLTKFASQGRHNRICTGCKGSAEYAAGSSIPDISFKVEA